MSAARLAGKAALVTGAAGGIGRALALGLAGEGALVHLIDLGDLAGALAELPSAGRGRALRCDVSDPAQIRTAFSQLDRLDVLVNCAGVTGWLDAVDPSEETWDRVIDTNLKGTFFCSIEAARLMRKRRWRLDRQRLIGARDEGHAELRRLRGEQGRDQRADGAARDRARAGAHPCQRFRPGGNERRAQPDRRSDLPRDVGGGDPARARRRADARWSGPQSSSPPTTRRT